MHAGAKRQAAATSSTRSGETRLLFHRNVFVVEEASPIGLSGKSMKLCLSIDQYSPRWWKPSAAAAKPPPPGAPTTLLLAPPAARVAKEGRGDEDANGELVFKTSTKGAMAKGMPSTKVSTSRMICGEMTG